MSIALSFLGFVGLAALITLTDWRRGWLLAILAGVLQDPVRKITPGTPVWLSMSVVGIYGVILVAHQMKLQRELQDFVRRFRNVWASFGLVLAALGLALINGIMTFGIENWKAPVLSLFLYLAPLPAVLLGYMYIDREERILMLFRFYAVITSVALIGSLLEYLRVQVPALGMVAQSGDYIRYLPGIELRMISGFYRAPDIMAWHAATLTAIAIASIIRLGFARRAWPWIVAAGWGYFNAFISGRRKALYYIVVFAAVLVWRYFRKLTLSQLTGVFAAALVIAWVGHRVSTNEGTSDYARAAGTTREELSSRLEGGMFATLAQNGVLGAGLGSATQGVYHVASNITTGWQEGGLGKLTSEIGVPGLISLLFFGASVFKMMFRIASFPDEPCSSQIVRVTLFALVIANVANFMASAQTYSDALLTLLAAFFAGCLFATARLEVVAPGAVAEEAPRLSPLPA